MTYADYPDYCPFVFHDRGNGAASRFMHLESQREKCELCNPDAIREKEWERETRIKINSQ